MKAVAGSGEAQMDASPAAQSLLSKRGARVSIMEKFVAFANLVDARLRLET